MKHAVSYVKANRVRIADGYPRRKGWNWLERTAALRLGTRDPNAGRCEAIPYRASLYTPKPMFWGVPRIMTSIYARRSSLDEWSRFRRSKQHRK